MSIILCDFMDPIWINIFKKIFSINEKLIFIDDRNFLKNLKTKKIKYYKFILKNYCRRNLYYSNKKKSLYHKEKFFKRYYEISKSMIKRYDPYNHFSKKEFDILFNDTVNFWLRFLKHHKVKLFFSKTSPHQFYDYIIYACCKKLGIKTSFFCLTYLKDRIFLINNVDKRDVLVKKNIKIKNKFFDSKESNYLINKIKGNYNKSKPKYISKEKNNFLKTIYFLNLTILKIIFVLISNRRERSEIEFKKKKYDYKSKKYLFSNFDMYLYQFKSLIKKFYLNIIYFYYSFNFTTPKKFIYFASQFQPEATSCPDGGVFNDNVKLLKRIRKYTPKDISIVYKEHPASFNPNPNLNGDISRSFSYYKNLSNIKNLVFAKLNYDSFKLMDKSIFCSTVAGQLGFESTIRNNYCVIFSRAWYKNFPKIIYIDNIKKIKKIFKKINKYQKRKEELEIKNCIHFFLKHSLKTRICNDDYIYEPKDITRVSNYLKKSL